MARQANPPPSFHRRTGSRLLVRQHSSLTPSSSVPRTSTTSLPHTTSSFTQQSLSSAVSSNSTASTSATSFAPLSSISASETSASTGNSSFTSFTLSSATPTASNSTILSSSSISSTGIVSSSSSSTRSTRSSSRGPSSAFKTASVTAQIIPAATTLILTSDVSDTSTSTGSSITYDPSSMATNSPISAAASSNSFWDNKGAVGGTFAVVGIILLCVLAAAIGTFIKRRNAQREARLRQGLFVDYSDHGHSRNHSDSPTPSINSAPLDAFETRQFISEYPISRDPFGGNDSYIATAVPTASSSSIFPQSDNYGHSSVRQTEAAPPVSIRPPAGRDSTGQQSIDSFYGVASQPGASAY